MSFSVINSWIAKGTSILYIVLLLFIAYDCVSLCIVCFSLCIVYDCFHYVLFIIVFHYVLHMIVFHYVLFIIGFTMYCLLFTYCMHLINYLILFAYVLVAKQLFFTPEDNDEGLNESDNDATRAFLEYKKQLLARANKVVLPPPTQIKRRISAKIASQAQTPGRASVQFSSSQMTKSSTMSNDSSQMKSRASSNGSSSSSSSSTSFKTPKEFPPKRKK